MKQKLTTLIFIIILSNLAFSQSFQRMAISKGSYKLSAKGSSKVTAYCLDYSRKSPKGGMNYENVLSGGGQAVVEIVSSAGDLTRMTLDDAVRKGYVGIEGAGVLEGKGKEMLTGIVKEAKSRGEDVTEFKNLLGKWDELSIREKTEVENLLSEMLGLAGDGNHTAMKFVNKTDNKIEIKLDENLQIGSQSEKTPVANIEKLSLSPDAAKQDEIQREIVWIARESENLETLRKIGFYDGKTNVTTNNFENIKKIYKDIQSKNNLRYSEETFGVFDEGMETWAKKQEGKIRTDLNDIGLNGDFDNVVRQYQKFKGEKQTGKFSKTLRESLKSDIDKGIFISKKGDVYDTKTLKTPTGQERMFVMKPNLYVKFKNKNSIDVIKRRLNSRKYLQEEVEVISLVNDDATNTILKQNFPENHLSFDIPSMKGLVKKLKANKKKSVVVVGHIEGKDFVTPLANGEKFKISLEDLKRLGDDLDVNIFPMGCNSGFHGTGLGNKFNSIDALNRLKPAVENNTTVMGMLEDLSGNDLKIIIDDIPFQEKGYLQAKIQRENTKAGVATIVGGGAAGVIIYVASGDEEEEDKK